MTVLIASDLDRTLIYSAAAMTLGEPVLDPVCVEVYDGRDTSFISPIALKNLVALSGRVAFVPVTTRTVEQYSRIRLPDVVVRHAVTTNGANILVDGVVCRDWVATVDANLTACAPYAEASAVMGAVLDRPWVLKRRSAEDRFLYAVFDPSLVEVSWFDEIEATAASLDWVVSVQGRKAYAIPRPLTKEAALAEIATRIGASTLVAAGDSLLDRGILAAADFAVRPAHGELHEQRWRLPGLHVTRSSGGGAGAEIIEHFATFAP